MRCAPGGYRNPEFGLLGAVGEDTHNVVVVVKATSARGLAGVVQTGPVFEQNERAFSRYGAADLTIPATSLVLAALGAGLVLAVAGSKTRGSERRRAYALARCVVARTTGKTRIRRRTGKALPNAAAVTGVRGCRPSYRDQKQSAQDPLHCRPPRSIQPNAVSEHSTHYLSVCAVGRLRDC